MLAYSYTRFSSKKQAKGDSLRRQMALTQNWCERNGATLAVENFEDLGVSGWTGENWREGGLSMFLAAVRGKGKRKIKKGSYLVVENLDRLSRDEIDRALGIFCEIIRTGINIVTLMPERIYTKDTLSNPMALLEAVLTFVLANEESNKKSKRLKERWADKRKKGEKIGGLCPAWLRWDRDRKEYHVIPEKADVVKLIYKLSADGMGSYAIIRHLHEKKIGSIGFGGTWNHSYVSLLLHHRGVIGERTLRKEIDGKRVVDVTIPDYYPSIVDRPTFFKVQETLAIRETNAGFRGRGAKNYRNLFSGLLVDARDGSSLILHHQRKPSMKKVWQYIVSHNALRKVPGACFITFPYPELENAILLALSSHLSSNDFYAVADDATGIIDEKEAELADVKANIKTIKDRIMKGASAKTLIGLLEELDEKSETLQAEVEKLKAMTAKDPFEEIEEVCSAISDMHRAKGKARNGIRARLQGHIRTVLDKVYVLLSKSPSKRQKQGNPYDKHALVELRLRNGQYWQMTLTYWGGELSADWEGQSDVSLLSLPETFDRTDSFARLAVDAD